MRNKTTVIQTPSVVTLSDPTSVAVSKDSREMVETAPVNICFVLCVLYAVSEIVILGKVIRESVSFLRTTLATTKFKSFSFMFGS